MWSRFTRPASFASLLQAIVKNPELARVVFAILPSAISDETSHRSLVAFNLRLGLDYIGRVELNPTVVAFLLPGFLAVLNHDKDCTVKILKYHLIFAHR